ncbi:hypothetical protein EDC23_1656 [Thiohalophilus thiocyanatoxydans]|uniref:Uncharacterized protein n=1 Tax=Thiohalophilus thiocyanatoxydans TaxID=381308 RepID=A0A4V3H443_9GAMM|nr:hypothetical protein EDC23_1656 [Thiohalophilus thiocyanatoxydans]
MHHNLIPGPATRFNHRYKRNLEYASIPAFVRYRTEQGMLLSTMEKADVVGHSRIADRVTRNKYVLCNLNRRSSTVYSLIKNKVTKG